jgi:H+/Cl- antiporter ClcA
VGHTSYDIPFVPALSAAGFASALVAGAAFGLAGMVFAKSTVFWGRIFSRCIAYAPLRPVVGGAVLAAVVFASGTTKYVGLGIPTILAAFSEPLPVYDAAVKIVYTSFTLGAGFKGGEVTPLFFTGATLGNALSRAIPLPMALLAGMGFVAVFAGATNTPLTCTIMAIELFGAESSVYMALACVAAYIFSGHSGIYGSQVIGSPKYLYFGREKGQRLSAIPECRRRKNPNNNRHNFIGKILSFRVI